MFSFDIISIYISAEQKNNLKREVDVLVNLHFKQGKIMKFKYQTLIFNDDYIRSIQYNFKQQITEKQKRAGEREQVTERKRGREGERERERGKERERERKTETETQNKQRQGGCRWFISLELITTHTQDKCKNLHT